jgi:hypothetical protein
MLCNDRAVLGPWVNRRGTNVFTSVVISRLVALSAVLTASVVFPGITGRQILLIVLGCMTGPSPGAAGPCSGRSGHRVRSTWTAATGRTGGCRRSTCCPSRSCRRPQVTLTVLGSYMAIAMVLVIVRIVQLAIGS